MKYESEEWKRRIAIANEVSLIEYCEHIGIPLVPFGREWRHRDYDSLKLRGNKWKRWSGKTEMLGRFTQGYPIHFVMEYEGVDFDGALEKLLAFGAPHELPLPENKQEKFSRRYDVVSKIQSVAVAAGRQNQAAAADESEKPFVLPNKNANNEKIYTYLTKTRCIAPELVEQQLALGLLYESAPNHNCVFVGHDDNGNPAYAFQRGTLTDHDKKFAGEVSGSNKEWIWRYTPDSAGKKLFVFESVIDALAFMTIHLHKSEGWKSAHYLPLGGVEDRALVAYLQRYPHIESIVFCLDNDHAGIKATEKLTKTYSDTYICGNMPPPNGYKDWDEYLVSIRTPKES